MPTINKQNPQNPAKKRSNSVLDRIQPIGFSENDGLKVLLYGQSGTGKTTTWATFPAPILAIICSGGKKSGELRSVNTPENRKRISSVIIHETSELREIINDAAPNFKTVVLDHVSGLQDFVLKEVLNLDEIPVQKTFGMATQGDYGTCAQMCKEYLRALLNLQGNVVIVGQERVFNTKEDNINTDIITPVVGCGVIPSLAGWLNPSCDYIMQTFKRPKMVLVNKKIPGSNETKATLQDSGKKEFCARIAPHDVFTTKFRVPKGYSMPDVIVDPDYDKIMAVINGTYKAPIK